MDFTHLSEEEKINGIKMTNVPQYIREKAYLTDFSETLAQLAEMIIQLGVNLSLDPDEALEWARKLQESVSQSEFDSWVATLLDGGPSLFFETKAALVAKHPNGAPGVALVRETDPAKIYVWNGTAWEDFGAYQGIEIKDRTVTSEKLALGAVTPSETDFVKISGRNLFNKATVKAETSGNLSSEFLELEANTTYYTNLPAKINVYTQDGTLATAGLDELNIADTFTNPYFKIVFEPQYLDSMMLVKIPYVPNRTEYPEIEYEPYTGGEEVYAFDKKVKIALSDVGGVELYKGLNLFNKATVKTESSGNLSSEFLELEANTTYYTNLPAKINVYTQDGTLATAGLDELNIADTFTNPYFKIVFEPQYLDSMMLVKIPYVPNRTEYPEIEFEPYTGGEGVYTLDKKLLANIENNNVSDTVANNEPYELYLPDFSGTDEPWHPSVIYIKEGFAGYKYWLTQSVYPNKPDLNEQKDRYEVPIVYKSNDGINWIVVANPLDDLTESEITNKSYMSDPHIVYNDDLKQIEVWYRLSHVVGSTLPTTIFRKITKDGETWTEREVTVPENLHTASDFARSPSFIYDNGIYKMWKTNNEGIYYQESTDAKVWTTQTPVTAPGASDGTVGKRWHIDVSKYTTDEGVYHLVVYNMDSNTVEHYSGEDGLTFTFKGTILKIGTGESDLHNTRLYKSASMMDELGNIRLYFTGTGTRHIFANGAYKANVGVYIAPTWNEILNLDTDDYGKLKQSLNDLQFKALGMEITKAQYKVDNHSRI